MTHLDSVPSLRLRVAPISDLIGSGYQQDVDLVQPFSAVAGFNQLVMSSSHAEMCVDLACKFAIENKDVAHISIPIDIQEQEESKKQQTEHKVAQGTSNVLPSVTVPPRANLESAASILNAGKKVVIMVGAGR
jgi:pyruvate dehydrogenase (quinone)